MLGLALTRRSLSALRSALPAVVSVPRLPARCNSTSADVVAESRQSEKREESVKLAAAEYELFGTSRGSSEAHGTFRDPSMLPLPDTPDVSQGPFSEEVYAASYVPGRSIHLPFLHPRTRSIPVATIHFRSYHIELLELLTHFTSHAATALGIPISRVVKLPTQRTLWTVPRSPFVHKKSQENFERKVHKRLIKAWDADAEVVERWVKYLRKHALGGVGMRIVRWDRMPLGVGRKRLEGITAQLEGFNASAAATANAEPAGPKMIEAEIKKLGEQIIKRESSQ
ncbi:hypothetical protein AX17_002421 [Amanita inopinata Kibby_2008]|nr:hypothetical protein AX17_002421 [Amanita inopinata Kibby_2008]